MADDVSPLRAGPEALPTAASPVLVEPAPDRRERARRSSYRLRFGAVYVALAVVLGAAVGVFLVLLMRPPAAEPEPWSSWRPEGRENQYPVEIADHVAAQYHLPSGRQLVGVLAGPAEVRDLPIRAVLIQHESATPTRDDDVEVVEVGSAVMYTFCGIGAQCSIAEGEPSESRTQLLRREALELALYSFRYVDDVDSVVTFLPPAPDAETGTVLYLKRSDLKAQLDAPLGRSLLPLERLGPADVPPTETELIDTLTKPRLYTFDFQQSPTGGAVMILDPAV